MKNPIVPLFVLSLIVGCSGKYQVPGNCDYRSIAESAIYEAYPDFIPIEPTISLVRRGEVVEAYYPLPRVMPGGTAHAEIRVSDCTISAVYVSQ